MNEPTIKEIELAFIGLSWRRDTKGSVALASSAYSRRWCCLQSWLRLPACSPSLAPRHWGIRSGVHVSREMVLHQASSPSHLPPIWFLGGSYKACNAINKTKCCLSRGSKRAGVWGWAAHTHTKKYRHKRMKNFMTFFTDFKLSLPWFFWLPPMPHSSIVVPPTTSSLDQLM